MQATAVHAVYRSAKAVWNGAKGSGETARIVLNFAKVASHCYGTLTWCIFLPGTLKSMLAVLSLLAVDIFAETRAPCWITDFDYYIKLQIHCIDCCIALLLIILKVDKLFKSTNKKKTLQ